MSLHESSRCIRRPDPRRCALQEVVLGAALVLLAACANGRAQHADVADSVAQSAPDGAAIAPDASVPTNERAKEAWVARFVNTDIEALFPEMARQHGFTLDGEPEGWLRAPYVASARERPDVADYFTRYAAYARDLEEHIDPIIDSIARRRIRMAGFSPDKESEFRDGFLRGLARTSVARKEVLAAMRRQAETALELHAFLIDVDPRVDYVGADGSVTFRVPREQRRYGQLAQKMEDATVFLQTLLQRQEALLDSLRKLGDS